jgi:hypothetical protein
MLHDDRCTDYDQFHLCQMHADTGNKQHGIDVHFHAVQRVKLELLLRCVQNDLALSVQLTFLNDQQPAIRAGIVLFVFAFAAARLAIPALARPAHQTTTVLSAWTLCGPVAA